MKHFSLLLLSFFCSLALCLAQDTIEGRIVDAETGEPLPYAKVYTANKIGTLSNLDGYFRLVEHENTKLKITYIGYRQLECTAAEARGVMRMEPLVNQMGQVTVLAYNMSDLVKQIIKELKNSYKKGKKGRELYFYRITFSNGKRHELVEAFLKANAAVNLRNLAITSGIMAGDYATDEAEVGITSTNVHRILEVGAKTFDSYRWQNCIKPFDKVSTFKKYYEASATSIGKGDEEIIKILFKEKDKRKNRNGKGLMVGTAYVRASDKRLLRFDGEVLYQFMNSGLSRVPMDFKFNMEYDYSKGYAEMSTLAIEGGGEFEPNLLSHLSTLNYRTVLFRITEDSLAQKGEHKLGKDMLSVVKHAGYDSELWNNYEVIRRTEREERIAFGENLITRHMMTDRSGKEYLPHEDSTDNQKINDMLLRQKRFAAMIPQEKVFVHMDNNCYFLGDTIWFAAYTRKTNTDRPSDMSKVLYVELLNHDGYLVERKKLHVQNGRANGFFALNKDIQYSGFYELRAYTRWQLNWGVTERPHSLRSRKWFISKELEKQFFRDYEKLYSRVFPVYDQRDGEDKNEASMTLRPLRRQAYRMKAENPIHINLYPEGGSLVEGLPGRVAFEVCREDGEWMEGTVYLTDGKENGPSHPTLHRGRGYFEVTPQAGKRMEVYFISDQGEVATVPLPQAEKSGASLCIEHEGFAWKINCNISADILPEKTGLVVSHEGKVFAFYSPKAQSAKCLFEPPRNISGVFQATLFTEDGKVLADRLFFHRSEGMHTATLQIKGLEEKYCPYAPICFSVEGSEAHRGTRVSLAVREGGTVPGNYDTGNILTEMLLASEIRGFVPEPEWYFESNDSLHRKALDLLMMTQGWRRFKWQDMAVSGNWELTQPREKHLVLKGRVYPANPADPRLREIEDAQILLNPEYSDVPIGATHWEYTKYTANSGKVKTVEKESKHKRKAKNEYDNEYYLHAQLESGEDIFPANDLKTRNGGTFEAQIPDFYGTFTCYLAATPINKYNPYRKFKWKEMSDPEYLTFKELTKSSISPAKTLVLVDYPYPRFVKPYAYHQTHLRKQRNEDTESKLEQGQEYTELSIVDVTEKSRGLLGYSDRYPAFMLDHFDALNATIDAGLYYALNTQMHTQLGDMGLENISGREEDLVSSFKSIGTTDSPKMQRSVGHRMGATPELRLIRTHRETPEDSIYNPKYLMSMPAGIYISKDNMRQYLGLGAIDKSIYYTDYSPRLAGDKRYMTDFPAINIAHYPHASGGQYPVFADRYFRLPGFSETASFYSPDYSKQHPDGNTKDYRRTLYWNPSLKLDENGKASLTIYNNGRTTTPVVETAGQATDGTLLWNE